MVGRKYEPKQGQQLPESKRLPPNADKAPDGKIKLVYFKTGNENSASRPLSCQRAVTVLTLV
jgi:hypothetical protein